MTAPVVHSKTINLAHYQWLFKAVMQQWTKSMLQYSCQELDFPPTLNIAIWSHRRSFSRSSSWMKRHSKYDNMILHYRQKKIHCCCATLRQAHTLVYQHQQPTKNQQKHAHARVDPTRLDDRREGGGEDARYVSLTAPCVHYQKSDHLFCESLFVPRWSRSMDFLHEVHFKNSCQKFSSAHLLVYVMRYFTCIYYRYSREMLTFCSSCFCIFEFSFSSFSLLVYLMLLQNWWS